VLWHLLGFAAVLSLVAIRQRAGQAGPFWMIFFSLPTSLLHEIAHFIVALFTNGRPSGLSLWPRAQVETTLTGGTRKVWVLGTVTFSPGPFSTLPTALAPLLYLPLAASVLFFWPLWFPGSGPHLVAMYLLAYLFLASAKPSRQDLKIAFSDITSLAVYAIFIGLFYFFWEDILRACYFLIYLFRTTSTSMLSKFFSSSVFTE